MPTQTTLGRILARTALPLCTLPAIAPAASVVATAPLPVITLEEAPSDQVPSGQTRAVMGRLEEVVVTAQRRTEPLDDVPMSVEVYSAGDLQDRGVADARDLYKVVPTLTTTEMGFNRPIYTLRGVGFNDPSQTATSPVSVYLDEVLLPYDVMTSGALLDLERVEVMKGPQSVLFGRNTTGGAINFVAARPTAEFESGVRATYGSYETADVEAYASGRVADGLLARGAIRYTKSQEGWQESLTRPDDTHGRVDRYSARLRFDWQPLDDLRILATFAGWGDRSDAPAPQPLAIDPQNPLFDRLFLLPVIANHPLVAPGTRDTTVAEWPATGDWALNNSFQMAGLRSEWTIDESTSLVVVGGYQNFVARNSELPQNGLSVVNIESSMDLHIQSGQLEVRLIGTSDGGTAWQVGAFASRDHVDDDLLFLSDTVSALFPLPLPGLTESAASAVTARLDGLGLGALAPLLVTPGRSIFTDRVLVTADQRSQSVAAFGYLQWPLSPTVNATAGLRYTLEERDYTGCTADSGLRSSGAGLAALIAPVQLLRPVTNPGSPIPTELARAGGCVTIDYDTNNAVRYRDGFTEDNVSTRLALDWRFTPRGLAYALFSRGYKSGSYPVPIATDSRQLEPVTQERVDAVEVGARMHGAPRRWTAAATAFYYDYKDKQVMSRIKDPLFGELGALRNAPRSWISGAELEVSMRPSQGLSIGGHAAYLRSQITQFTGIDEQGEERDYSGEEMNLMPRRSYTVTGEYAHPVRATMEVFGAADYSYKSATSSSLSDAPLFEHNAYGITNARLGIRSSQGAWGLTFWALNLFDEMVTTGVFDPGDAVARYVGPPRMLGLSLVARLAR